MLRPRMKYRGWSTSVACLVAALLAAPSPASARHHKRKAKRAAPAAARPSTDDAETPRPAPTTRTARRRRRAAPAAPEPPAPRGARAREIAPRRGKRRSRHLAPYGAKLTGRAAAPTAGGLVSFGGDDGALALGRREAARLALGRIEVAASVGIDVGRRQFTYSDPIGAMPRPYLLAAAPLATFELEVYPLASTDIPVLRDLGFRGRVSRAFALDSAHDQRRSPRQQLDALHRRGPRPPAGPGEARVPARDLGGRRRELLRPR